jgi:hypothetical protein
MPRAQVLQEFRLRMWRQNFRGPPSASKAFLNVYPTAAQPPPDFTVDMGSNYLRRETDTIVSQTYVSTGC